MTIKKIVNIILMLAIIAGLSGVGLTNILEDSEVLQVETNFTDIQNHWAFNEIASIEARGFLSDMDSEYKPEKVVTRTEFFKMMDKIFDYAIDDEELTENPALKEINDFINSDAELNITRIEAARLIEKSFRAKRLSVMMTLIFPVFADTTEEESGDLGFVFNTGIMKGRSDGQFCPHDELTRAELAVVLNRTLATIEIAEPY